MYWCKPKPFLVFFSCLSILASCKPEIKSGGQRYFAIEKYFKSEADKLTKLHPAVIKSVNYNGQAELKTVTIKNWKQELGLFIESDINKPAWRSSYRIKNKGDSITYTAIDTNLRTRNILVILKGNKVKQITIRNFTKNLLYQSCENLSYFPDSIYSIEKHQAVKILGVNNYKVTGKIQ